jgi:hypothetical protein
MKLIDLEMYRWRFHNDMYVHTRNQFRPDKYPPITWVQYWKEHGAFVSVLPRQSGKSTMLTILAKSIANRENEMCGDYRIVCSFFRHNNIFTHAGLDRKKILNGRSVRKGMLDGLQHSDIHLMIDEFDYLDMNNHLIHVLDYPWKSVTMVSSLK